MRHHSLKIAVIVTVAALAGATPALAADPAQPDKGETMITMTAPDDATTDCIGKPGGINSAGTGTTDGQMSAI